MSAEGRSSDAHASEIGVFVCVTAAYRRPARHAPFERVWMTLWMAVLIDLWHSGQLSAKCLVNSNFGPHKG